MRPLRSARSRPAAHQSATYPERLTRARRRALGSYYTPERIVRHVAGRALGPLLPRLCRAAAAGRLDDALRLRVLDPAAGDGAFLRAAAALIARRLATAAGVPAASLAALVQERCVQGIEIDPEAAALARDALGAAVVEVSDALAEALPLGAPRAGFDVVVGNPPWGGWSRTIPRSIKDQYRRRFRLARGIVDPCAMFIERATELLASGGRLGLVLPDYILLKNYPAVRRHLLDNYEIEEMVHWGRAFPGVNLDAFSLVARRRHRVARAARRGRGGATASPTIRCFPGGPEGRMVEVPRSRIEAAPGHAFNLSLDAAGAALLARLEAQGTRLGDWMEAHEGIHSGNIRAKLFLPPSSSPPAGARTLPLILGRDEIRPFAIRWAGWRVLYDPRVVDREAGEYASLGRRRWFTPAKILVRRTGDHLLAALDRSGLYASNNLFVALRREGCPVPLEFLEAYLNSSLATWCFRAIQPRAGRLFAELKLIHLNRLPVPRPPDAHRLRELLGFAARLRRRAAAPSEAPPSVAADRAALDAGFADLAGLSAAQTRRLRTDFTPAAHSL